MADLLRHDNDVEMKQLANLFLLCVVCVVNLTEKQKDDKTFMNINVLKTCIKCRCLCMYVCVCVCVYVLYHRKTYFLNYKKIIDQVMKINNRKCFHNS